MRTLSVVLGLAVGFMVAVLPSCGAPRCSAATCALGCCDTAGRCQTSSNLSCGANGAACVACSLSQSCVSGQCMGGSSGAGAGGGPTGGGSGTGGGSSGTGYSAFIDNFSSAYCAKAIECGALAAQAQADCTVVIRQLFANSGSGIGSGVLATERSVLAGAATFDSVRGQACLTSIAAIPCLNGSPSGSPSDCSNLTTPTAAANATCFMPSDCVDTTLGCNGGPCARRCTPGGNLGESCRADGTCTTPFVCINNTCVNEPAPGSSCVSFLGCGPRMECQNSVCVQLPTVGLSCPNFRCVPGAYCESPSRICRAQKPLNSTCQTNGECVEGTICTAGLCSMAAPQGATCRISFECQRPLQCIVGRCNPPGGSGARCFYSSDCQSSLGCDDVLKICRPYTSTQATGQACSSTQSCQGVNDICRNKVTLVDGGTGTPGTCGVPQVGDPCAAHYECGQAKYCDPTAPRTCRAAGAATPCSSSSNCLSTDYCTSSSVCATKAASGQVCDSSRSESCAAAGERCITVGATSRCQRTPGLGEACSTECLFPWACSGGLCVAAGRVGQPCIPSSPVPCIVGECLQADAGIGRNGSCVAARVDGAPCQSNLGCQSGYCDLRSGTGSGAGVCVAACR